MVVVQGREIFLAKEHYANKVKAYIYAVEQSLDNYKFNLLKNKQTFISQMKNCELNVRMIDEGGIDDKSGMNFSEYIAIRLENLKKDKSYAFEILNRLSGDVISINFFMYPTALLLSASVASFG